MAQNKYNVLNTPLGDGGKIKADGLQAQNDNQFSKQILKFKQWQKNLSKGINPI
jgi:hypothetical protein